METSGLDDLIAAFAEDDRATATATATETSVAETPADPQKTPKAEAAKAETPAVTAAADVLSREDVRRIVAEERIQAVQQAQAAQQAQTQAMIAAQMPDADYGRMVRAQHSQAQVYGHAAQQAAVQIFGQLWGQVTTLLKKEGVPEESWPDPQKFDQFEDLLSAVGETVSDRRADKKAEKLAQTKADAIVKERLGNIYRELPIAPALAGGLPPTNDLPDTAPGRDWLLAGLIEMDRN